MSESSKQDLDQQERERPPLELICEDVFRKITGLLHLRDIAHLDALSHFWRARLKKHCWKHFFQTLYEKHEPLLLQNFQQQTGADNPEEFDYHRACKVMSTLSKIKMLETDLEIKYSRIRAPSVKRLIEQLHWLAQECRADHYFAALTAHEMGDRVIEVLKTRHLVGKTLDLALFDVCDSFLRTASGQYCVQPLDDEKYDRFCVHPNFDIRRKRILSESKPARKLLADREEPQLLSVLASLRRNHVREYTDDDVKTLKNLLVRPSLQDKEPVRIILAKINEHQREIAFEQAMTEARDLVLENAELNEVVQKVESGDFTRSGNEMRDRRILKLFLRIMERYPESKLRLPNPWKILQDGELLGEQAKRHTKERLSTGMRREIFKFWTMKWTAPHSAFRNDIYAVVYLMILFRSVVSRNIHFRHEERHRERERKRIERRREHEREHIERRREHEREHQERTLDELRRRHERVLEEKRRELDDNAIDELKKQHDRELEGQRRVLEEISERRRRQEEERFMEFLEEQKTDGTYLFCKLMFAVSGGSLEHHHTQMILRWMSQNRNSQLSSDGWPGPYTAFMCGLWKVLTSEFPEKHESTPRKKIMLGKLIEDCFGPSPIYGHNQNSDSSINKRFADLLKPTDKEPGIKDSGEE